METEWLRRFSKSVSLGTCDPMIVMRGLWSTTDTLAALSTQPRGNNSLSAEMGQHDAATCIYFSEKVVKSQHVCSSV